MGQLKPLLLFCVFCLSTLEAVAQTLKKYQGPFEGIKYQPGKAEYSYFEEENQGRIFAGKYLFTRGGITVTGQFENNKKVGIWTYTQQSVASYGTGTEKLTGTYIDGKMEGKWVYTHEGVEDKKPFKTTSVALFKDNNFTGDFYYASSASTSSQQAGFDEFVVNGSFNAQGLLTGEWKVKAKTAGITYESGFSYREGICYKMCCRESSAGNLVGKADSTTFINEFFAHIDTASRQSTISTSQDFFLGTYQGPVEFEGNTLNQDKIHEEMLKQRVNQKSLGYSFIDLYESIDQAAPDTTPDGVIHFWMQIHDGTFFEIERGSAVSFRYPWQVIFY